MKILITESQRKMILTENVLDELTRKISNISESGKEVIETASQQLGINLKFLLTYGLGVGTLYPVIGEFLKGVYPSLTETQILNLVIAAISVVYFNSKTETSEIVEKLQEDGLETELDSATKRIKLMSSKLSKILNNLSGVSFALIDILAYTALTHVIPYLGKIVFDIGSEATSEVALKALGMSVGLTMFGSSIKKVLKMLSKKLESHENV
jgi:hypothetical protein